MTTTTVARDDNNHARWATYATDRLRNNAQPLTFETWLTSQVEQVPDSAEDLYPGFLAYTRTLGTHV